MSHENSTEPFKPNKKKLNSFLKNLEKINIAPVIKSKKKLVAIVLLMIALIITVYAYMHSSESKKSAETEKVNAAIYYQVQKSSKDLNLISQQVSELSNKLSQKRSVVELDSLKASLSKISTQIQSMKDENSHSIAQLMKNQGALVNQKLDSLQAGVTALQAAENKAVYLSEKELPFLVESVDLIQQQPVVTVRYDHKSQPLDIGYTLAGWELKKANFAKQCAEFRNHKDQHILVHLTQRGAMA